MSETTYYARSDVRYQGGEKIFSIPFPYINKSHIKVFCNKAEITDYQYNNDYEIEVTAPLENGDLISIQRSTPLDQRLVDFSDTSILDKNVQNLDSTQTHYLVQEMYDKFGFTVVEDFEQLKQETQELQENAQEILNESETNVELARQEAERAAQYADEVEFGMRWTPFYIANWQVDEDDYYKLVLSDIPIVTGVYKGTWGNKTLVDCDIITTDNGCIIKSIEAFDGFVVGASSVIGKYIHEQTLASDEWVITHNLGKIPQIIILNNDNIEIFGTKQHVSLSQCVVSFESPQTGTAYLS